MLLFCQSKPIAFFALSRCRRPRRCLSTLLDRDGPRRRRTGTDIACETSVSPRSSPMGTFRAFLLAKRQSGGEERGETDVFAG